MVDQASGLLSPWLRKKRIKKCVSIIQGKVLDYGCGTGSLAEICRHEAYLGFDIDKEALEVAGTRHQRFHFTSEIPENEHFDTIVSLAVIEHIADQVALLSKFKRMLAPDGRIVLTTPHPSGERMHTLGSKIGLFSAHASREHERLIDLECMEELATRVGLFIEIYERFLFGVNQMFVLKKI